MLPTMYYLLEKTKKILKHGNMVSKYLPSMREIFLIPEYRVACQNAYHARFFITHRHFCKVFPHGSPTYHVFDFKEAGN